MHKTLALKSGAGGGGVGVLEFVPNGIQVCGSSAESGWQNMCLCIRSVHIRQKPDATTGYPAEFPRWQVSFGITSALEPAIRHKPHFGDVHSAQNLVC